MQEILFPSLRERCVAATRASSGRSMQPLRVVRRIILRGHPHGWRWKSSISTRLVFCFAQSRRVHSQAMETRMRVLGFSWRSSLRSRSAFLIAGGGLLACGGPKGPTGAEKAAAYHSQESERAQAADSPHPPSVAQTTLQFPECKGKRAQPFPADTNGAAFRAILFLRITAEGRTSEHCYLAVEGDRKWEEKALGDVSQWTYSTEFAGEPRERVVTYRLRE